MKRFISWPCVLFCLFFLIACAPKTAQLSQTTPSNKLIVNTPPTSPISKQNSTIISATSQNKQVLQQTSTKHLTVANAEPVFVPYRQKFVLNNGQLSPYLQQWAEFVAQDRNIPLAVIEELLKQVRYDSQVINLMAPAQVKKSKRSWSAYKAQFVEPIRIDTGLRFWQQHQQIIDETSKKYQIPASILVAIIGVETIYGRYTGNFKVLNALTNLGFSYPDPNRPERAAMFREQLADFIELHYQNKVDALQAKGSYAGAMGLPQFMPTSIKKWAIDAENKGRIDLWG